MPITETQRILMLLHRDSNSAMTLPEIVGEEIAQFTSGTLFGYMLEAEQYYLNRSGVQNKSNEIEKRSNTKIEHPVLKKLIDQKISYTLSRPFSISSENKAYNNALGKIFNDNTRQKIKRFGRGSPRMGKGWMIPYISENGKFDFRVVPATNIVPLWTDPEHTELQGFIYFYPVIEYSGKVRSLVTKAEWWDETGVMYFAGRYGKFAEDPDRPGKYPHFFFNGRPYNWKTPPIVWCKYNDEELPLQYFLKDLIDDLNWQTSITADVLRDIAKFIWVLKNYGGEDLAEFVDDLRKYLAIKADSDGGVDTIQPDPQIESVLKFIDKQSRDALNYGAGVDTKDPNLGQASGKAIYFRYMDLDTDSVNLQSELKAAFLRLKVFMDDYFHMTGQGDFYEDEFQLVFNTDMPVDETEIFQNAQVARNIGVSMYTVLTNLPWIQDVDKELELIAAEKEAARQAEEAEIARVSSFGFPADSRDSALDGDDSS